MSEQYGKCGAQVVESLATPTASFELRKTVANVTSYWYDIMIGLYI